MNDLVTGDVTGLLAKVRNLEKQISELKLSLIKSHLPSQKNVVSLKGILKGIDISEKDISEAKKSLYSKVDQ